jgi:hypothetical protein
VRAPGERRGELASRSRDDHARTDRRQPILVPVCPTRECSGELASPSRDDYAIGRDGGPVLAVERVTPEALALVLDLDAYNGVEPCTTRTPTRRSRVLKLLALALPIAAVGLSCGSARL